jgi:sec-independent protein translocase protein TatA
MGFGGISPLSLLLILAIIILLFGTKKLRNIGGDLGGAIKSFKNSMSGGGSEKEAAVKEKEKLDESGGRIIDAEVQSKENKKA